MDRGKIADGGIAGVGAGPHGGGAGNFAVDFIGFHETTSSILQAIGESRFQLRNDISTCIPVGRFMLHAFFQMPRWSSQIFQIFCSSKFSMRLYFPSTVACGSTLTETRTSLAEALRDMAETNLLRGEPLPLPDHRRTDANADLEERFQKLALDVDGFQVRDRESKTEFKPWDLPLPKSSRLPNLNLLQTREDIIDTIEHVSGLISRVRL